MTRATTYSTNSPNFNGADMAILSSGEITSVTSGATIAGAHMIPWAAQLQRVYAYCRVTAATATQLIIMIGDKVTASKYFYCSIFKSDSPGVMQIFDLSTATSLFSNNGIVTPGDTVSFANAIQTGASLAVYSITAVFNPNY